MRVVKALDSFRWTWRADGSAGRPTASLLADFDHDGRVGTNEIQRIKDNLHHFFDIDDSGAIDPAEIQTVRRAHATAMSDNRRGNNGSLVRSQFVSSDKDVDSAFAKLDRDQDSVISLKELDERWESVGAEMTVEEVADWVAYSVQLPQYSALVRRHSISGYTFPLLMDNDGSRLEEIGVRSELHRRQLSMFLKMKYLGMGKKPEKVVATTCETSVTLAPVKVSSDSRTQRQNVFLHLSWTPAAGGPQQFQLQRRLPGEAEWAFVYSGPDAEYMDVIESEQQLLHVVYRLATWNSYGRSPHAFIRCEVLPAISPMPLPPIDLALAPAPGRGVIQAGVIGDASSVLQNSRMSSGSSEEAETPSLISFFRSYLWWLDEAIALALFIALPIRGFIYGDADYLLRLLRRLPPNAPTRVLVEADMNATTLEFAAAKVSWEKPADNGVPIVCYCVRWTRMKTDEVRWVKLLTLPLPTTVAVDKLYHGETYKFTVEATNASGLVTRSSRSTYMVPLPELKGKLVPRSGSNRSQVLRHQCYICHDPHRKKKLPFSATLDRKILHFCCLCDREFCHYHKGEVYHTKALSCPAVDGRCVCSTCKDIRLQRAETY